MGIGIGETLRSQREQQGRTVEEAARAIRVRSDYLEALEEENFGIFGGDVYAKGFLSSYARYLDLEPEPLLDTYRRYVQIGDYSPRELATRPVAEPGRRGLPAWLSWLTVLGVVLLLAVGVSSVLGGRSPDPADTRNAPPPPASPSPAASPSPPPSPTPSPTPAFEGVHLLLLVEERCWMEITVDGEEVAERIFQPGESPVFQAGERIAIEFGNPGGVRLELNGESLGFAGERGVPRTIIFTPEGATTPDGTPLRPTPGAA